MRFFLKLLYEAISAWKHFCVWKQKIGLLYGAADGNYLNASHAQ